MNGRSSEMKEVIRWIRKPARSTLLRNSARLYRRWCIECSSMALHKNRCCGTVMRMPPPGRVALNICLSTASSSTMCSRTSNAPITSNSRSNGIWRASIWYKSTPGNRARAKTRPSPKISLPANRNRGRASLKPLRTNPVPQPTSKKLPAVGK